MDSEPNFYDGNADIYFYKHGHCSVQNKDSQLRLIRQTETAKENPSVLDESPKITPPVITSYLPQPSISNLVRIPTL